MLKKSWVYRQKVGDLSYIAFSGHVISINALLLVICGPSDERGEICALELDADGTVSSIKIPADYHVAHPQVIA